MSPSAELVQIVDEQNREIAVVPRHEMRSQRLRHRCTYVLVFNSQGRLFVQTRTPIKDIYPSYLDLAAGGVTVAGESYDDGAKRELQEELGITGTPLPSHGVIYFEDKLSRVFGGVYSCTWDGPMRFQPEEVAGGSFLTVEEVFRKAEADEKITPDSIEALRHYLSQVTGR